MRLKEDSSCSSIKWDAGGPAPPCGNCTLQQRGHIHLLMKKLRLLGTLTGPSGSQNSDPNSGPCVFPKYVPRCPGIFLFSLSREASQSPHWDSLGPRVPVFSPHTLHIRKKDALQWWGAVLGTVARWLLLDSVHDHCGLSGVLHPTDNYQVRGRGAERHTFRLVIGLKSLWERVGMQDST